MTDEREAQREATRRRAREAYENGQALEAQGRLDEAAAWLERAHRLARADHTISFTLALLRLRRNDPSGAAALLLPVARATDGREAWMSLAIARQMQGLAADAAHMLGEALRRHAIDAADPSVSHIATSITRAAGAAGWCGVTADGRVLVRAVERGLDLAVVLDGKLCGGGTRTADGMSSDIDLPSEWTTAITLEILARGRGGTRTLIGTPIDLAAVLRVDGMVEPDGAGGLTGWLRHPNAPQRRGRVCVHTLAGRLLRTLDLGASAFAVPATALPAGLVRVVDQGGRDLLGSPLDPGLERRATASLVAIAGGAVGRAQIGAAARFAPIQADWIGEPPRSSGRRRRALAIVVPVHRGAGRTLDCLDSLERTVPRNARIHVVDDATPEPALAEALEARAAAGRIVLHRHPGRHSRGFPASANLGLVAAEGRDVVLLNSDTLVAGDWLARLRACAYAAADIGTATPLTNEGSILGYPKPRHANEMPSLAGTERLQALAALANEGRMEDLPTANGFCMFIRRDCLDAVGLLREDLFAQGYGEENDFCLRARHAGWRHVAALDVYVAHAGGTSFRAGREQLTRRNLALLNRLHPGYDTLIARHIEADPLASARRRLDLARLDASPDGRPSVLLVTHQAGGGVERVVRTRVRAIEAGGSRPVILRGDEEGECDHLCLVEPDGARAFPNLRFALPAERSALVALLRALRPDRIEIHHTLGHHPSITDICRDLAVPIDVWLHDYAWFCPRIALLGPAQTYCGEPPVATCRRCVAEAGSHLGNDLTVDALVATSSRLLADARRVVAASGDSARRLQAHFPGITVEIVAWEPAGPVPDVPHPRVPDPQNPLVVCIVGAIGPEKGIEILIACVRDAAARALPIRYVVVGHTSEDDRLLAAGPVFVTGPYDEDEAGALIRAQNADLAFLPSIWPETWCYALSECWRAGLAVVAFDIGAPAERIRSQGGGMLLPLATPPSRINDALIACGEQVDIPAAIARKQRSPSLATDAEGLVTAPQSARSMPRASLATKRIRDRI